MLGGVLGINTRHAPAIRALYGPVAIGEIYGTTEGMFGKQRDEHRVWMPNYDLYFFGRRLLCRWASDATSGCGAPGMLR